VRFIQQYEPSPHDYTAERDEILPDWDAKGLVRQMSKMKSKPNSRR
jgi:hypothetical protein